MVEGALKDGGDYCTIIVIFETLYSLPDHTYNVHTKISIKLVYIVKYWPIRTLQSVITGHMYICTSDTICRDLKYTHFIGANFGYKSHLSSKSSQI